MQEIDRECSRCAFKGEVSTNFPRFKSIKGETRYRSYCKQCEKQRKTAWRKDNIERHNAKSRLWTLNNKEKSRETKIKWVANNLEKDKEIRKRWKKLNPGLIKIYTKTRRTKLKIATPSWLTEHHKKEIQEIYNKVIKMNLEQGSTVYHVDHIIPINNTMVCGLHVPWNLQILKAEENLRKHNKVPS
jgi:hypothetical protein